VLEVLSKGGRGDGGRRVLQRNELFVHAFSVNTDVVVKSVAIEKPSDRFKSENIIKLDEPRLLLSFACPRSCWGVSPRTVKFRNLPQSSFCNTWAYTVETLSFWAGLASPSEQSVNGTVAGSAQTD
jgi:hypothetical protein